MEFETLKMRQILLSKISITDKQHIASSFYQQSFKFLELFGGISELLKYSYCDNLILLIMFYSDII